MNKQDFCFGFGAVGHGGILQLKHGGGLVFKTYLNAVTHAVNVLFLSPEDSTKSKQEGNIYDRGQK